jgi:hypothetical protein
MSLSPIPPPTSEPGDPAWGLSEATQLADRALREPNPVEGIRLALIAIALTLQASQDDPHPAASARALRRAA